MNIGVLGYSGTVGKNAVHFLLEKGLSVIGGQRNYNPLFDKYKNFSYIKVNVDDENTLDNFFEKCDIVVNCTSPSYIYGSAVAETAEKYGKIYIDPSDLACLDKQNCHNGKFILSCGYMPGFSEYLVKYISTKFDEVSKIMLFQGGTEMCSPSALADIVLSADKSGVGDSYFLKNEIIPLKINPAKTYSLPFFDGEVSIKPFLSYDFTDICKTVKAEKAFSFNVYPDKNILNMYFEAIFSSFEAGNDKRKIVENIGHIMEKYKKSDNQDTYCVLAVEAYGKSAGTDKYIRAVVHIKNSAELCGFFLSECVLSVINSELPENIYYGCQLHDNSLIKKITETLNKNISLTIEETDSFSLSAYEEFKNI